MAVSVPNGQNGSRAQRAAFNLRTVRAHGDTSGRREAGGDVAQRLGYTRNG